MSIFAPRFPRKQRFVPLKSVLQASEASVNQGLRTLISVETAKGLKFTESDLKKEVLYKKIKSSSAGHLLTVESTSWVSLTEPSKYDYDFFSDYGDYGCDSLFNDITVDADGDIYSCCGLTIRTIEEMKIGNINKNKGIKINYQTQFNDLLKKWIFVEGAYNIVKQAAIWDSDIKIPKYAHKCLYCQMIYKNNLVRQSIERNIFKLQEDILKRFSNKIAFINNFERGN